LHKGGGVMTIRTVHIAQRWKNTKKTLYNFSEVKYNADIPNNTERK